jgi:nicotinamidase-related amidase
MLYHFVLASKARNTLPLEEDRLVKEIYGKMVCETIEEVLNPAWCAVLPIDLQNDFMHADGAVGRAGGDLTAMEELLPKAVSFLNQTRELGIRIVHVRIVDLPDGESDSPAWIRAKGLISNVHAFAVEGTWGAQFSQGCEPRPGELVVTKHRSSAFVGTNLDLLLKNNGVKTVVIIGEQTPGCVEATYRDAAYYDFYNVLVEDCVAGRDRELHEASIKIQKARHDVVTMDQVFSIWRRYREGSLTAPALSGVPQLIG